MASKVGICNLALSHLSISKVIANLDTDTSEEGAACRQYYDIVLENILRDFPWPFTMKVAALALVATDPNTEWSYSYRYPVDCLMVRKILSGIRNDTRQSKVPYEISQDASGLLIFTDQTDAEIKYTIRAENPQFYPPDFTLAFSLYFAYLIAPRLTGGDQFKLGDRAARLYLVELSKANSRGQNEEQPDEPPDAEWIIGR